MEGPVAVAAPTDAELVATVLNGNRNAFAPLVERYQTGIYNFTYRYTHNREDAADLAQETFLRAFRSLHRYNKKYQLRNWLYSIAANVCRDWSRKNGSRPATMAFAASPGIDSSAEPAGDSSDNPAEIVLTNENSKALADAISQLPDDYRACLILFHIEGISQAEICQILQLPLSVVKNRLYRARLRLRQMLGEVS